MKYLSKRNILAMVIISSLLLTSSVAISSVKIQRLNHLNHKIINLSDFKDLSDIKLSDNYESSFLDSPTVEWSNIYGGLGEDSFYSMDITSDGGVIMSGETTSYGGGENDIWLIKIDDQGDEQWHKTFGGISQDWSNSVQQTSDGGYILAADTFRGNPYLYDGCLIKTDGLGNEEWLKYYGGNDWDLLDFVIQIDDSSFLAAGETYSFSGTGDVWLVKIDSNGELVWSKTYGGGFEQWANCIQQTSDGGVIIACTGYFEDANLYDGLLIKTDQDGNEEWRKYFGGTGYDFLMDVKQINGDGYILSGITGSYGSEGISAWLLCLDNDGDELWSNHFGELHYEYYGYSVDVCNDGGFIVSSKSTHLSTGLSDLKVIKTDSMGNTLWIATLGDMGYDYGYTVKCCSDGGYLISGESDSYGEGSIDGWLVKLSSFENLRPNTPAKPTGPSTGRSGVEMTYSSSSDDPDGDDLYYLFDWGDETISNWIGPFNSGETISDTHVWSETGAYLIRVKVRDIYHGESEWSEPIEISLSRNKAISEGLFNSLFDKINENFNFIRYLLEYKSNFNTYKEMYGGRNI